MHCSFQEQQNSFWSQVLPRTLAISQISSHHGGNPREPLHLDPTFSPAFLFCLSLEQQEGEQPTYLPQVF